MVVEYFGVGKLVGEIVEFIGENFGFINHASGFVDGTLIFDTLTSFAKTR